MIILDTTSKSLELLLGAPITTNQLSWTSSFVDITSTTFISASSDGVVDSVTAITAVTAPAASTQRQLKGLTVFNADTVQSIVTVQLNDSSNVRVVCQVVLQPGETLFYIDGEGFYVILADGSIKSGMLGPIGPTGPLGPTGTTGPATGVDSFNLRTGIVSLLNTDITNLLTSTDITNALGYVPVPPTITVNGYSLATPVVLFKEDVGLSNVDNTSDATKDAAVTALTNKTLNTALNVLTIGQDQSFAGFKITNLANPLVATDGATKFYVDSISTGLIWQLPIQISNLLGDTSTPPGSYTEPDSYLINVGGNTGIWSGFNAGM